MQRIGQPPIVGSLLAGLVARPSVFGKVWPHGFHWFLPAGATSLGALGGVAGFCLLMLLIGLGAETDLPLIRSLGRPAAAVIAASIVLPLAAGVAIALALPHTLLGPAGHRSAFVLLIAGAVSVTSLPVVARIVNELDLMRRDVGQLTVAAATVNDGYGFAVLALAVAVTSGGAAHLAVALGGLIAVAVLSATAGQRVVDVALRRVRRHGPDVASALAVGIASTLALAAVAQALGLDAALGAFIAGIVLGRSRFLPGQTLAAVEWASDAFFAPIYFATAGLAVDVTLLRHGSTAWACGLVLAGGFAAKYAGAWVGGALARLPGRERHALGLSLNGRGAMQVILGTAGLGLGVLNQSSYTAVILASIISTAVMPPLLSRAMRGWTGTAEEQRRLQREEQLRTNVIVRGQRLLLPSRGTANSFAAARVLAAAWPADSAVTVLDLGLDDERRDALVTLFDGREVMVESVDTDDVVEAILAEANLGYGVIAVGAAERPTESQLLRESVSSLLNRSPIPLLVVRRGAGDTVAARNPTRLLVPVTGNAASRAGQEVAETIAAGAGAEVVLLHADTRADSAGSPPGPARQSVDAVLREAGRSAAEHDLPAETVEASGDAGAAIAQAVRQRNADFVVMGCTVRRVDGRPFLGHTVEHTLEFVTAPTVVVVVLPDAQRAQASEHVDRTHA